MEKTTREIVAAYGLLKDAKLTKMEDADKFRLIKTLRALHKAADDYEAFRNEALEKLKGEGHDGIVAKAQQWQREGDKTTLTAEERIGVNRYFAEYNSKVEQCLKEEAEAVRDIGAPALGEDAFGKLVASNDWTLGQMEALACVLTEN